MRGDDASGTRSVSIFFPAGDFAAAVRNHAEGREHSYSTHGEVARLVEDLLARDLAVTLYSFMTPEAKAEAPLPGLKIVSMGGRSHKDNAMLPGAVAADGADAIIPHFPDVGLLAATAKTGKRAFPIIAGSFNRNGPRSRLMRWRTMRALNHPRFALVSNHCRPAAEELAARGVDRSRLIAWDVPHRRSPSDNPPRTRSHGAGPLVAYAGSITVDKGVADLVRALGILRRGGLDVRAVLAGNGEIEAMRTIAEAERVTDLVDFLGTVGNDRVLAAFAEADLAIVPSRAVFPEGFPLTLFEAIASRTPIVASDHPMFLPILRDGVGAAIFRNGDPASLAGAIRRVLGDDDLYARLSLGADDSWALLGGVADWRTLVRTWVTEGADAPWIRAHMLDARPAARGGSGT